MTSEEAKQIIDLLQSIGSSLQCVVIMLVAAAFGFISFGDKK